MTSDLLAARETLQRGGSPAEIQRAMLEVLVAIHDRLAETRKPEPEKKPGKR